MKYLLQAMRMFHYMVGITAPEPKNERKILFLWISIIFGLLLTGIGVVLFLIPRVMG